MENYTPGIGISAGLLMLKWDLLNRHLALQPMKIQKGDEVNVFINFESIMNNLTVHKSLASSIAYHKQKVVIELEAAILNLVAHYRYYFRKDDCKVNIYLYYTDLSKDTPQQMEVYNKYYRDFYFNKYKQVPAFRAMGELLEDIIIPEIELIMSYIPGCYFIKSKSFDSSVIPLAVSRMNTGKNIIITADIFDTLYMFNSSFIVLYVKRRFKHFNVTSDIESTVRTIIKDESPFDLSLFNSEMYYRLLIAINGSKIRNIRGTFGFGIGKLTSILKEGIRQGNVLKDFSSIDSIIGLFPEKYRDDMKQAFLCSSIDSQYEMLSEVDIEEIKSQMVDKIDLESVESLNNKRFLDNPINLSALLQ